MFTMKKLMGFLMVFVLETIIPMTVFPASEKTKIRQLAKVCPIFSAVGSPEQLDGCAPLTVVFRLSDIAFGFLWFVQLINATLFMFHRRRKERMVSNFHDMCDDRPTGCFPFSFMDPTRSTKS